METPTARQIVDRLGLSGKNTLELERASKVFHAQLRKHVRDENDVDKVSSYAAVMCGESHYIGFMQGFKLACTLLLGEN